jgi:hypothetical protein
MWVSSLEEEKKKKKRKRKEEEALCTSCIYTFKLGLLQFELTNY